MKKMNLLDLPIECIAAVISFTTPHDACRITTVSKLLHTVADSDAAWERFLPPESRLLNLKDDPLLSISSNKKLFFYICQSPLLIDNEKMCFWLAKRSGKKCLMLSAKKLEISWIDTPEYWEWIPARYSSFKEAAVFLNECCFEIKGKISSSLLSKDTIYVAYLVFQDEEYGYLGFDNQPLEAKFGSKRTELCNDKVVFLDSSMSRSRDVWLEMELGEYYVGFDEEELEISVLEKEYCGWQGSIVVQGIELRPKGM